MRLLLATYGVELVAYGVSHKKKGAEAPFNINRTYFRHN
jgi:hypothetical protein